MNPKTSQRGVAILLVMSAIMLLTILLASFSYDSELNKLKVFNAEDRVQAKLNSESGLQFALLKLRLFQQAKNTLEKNKSLKDVLPEHKIQGLITQPFIFPPPLPPSADIIQKNAVKDFVDSSVIDGMVSVTISPITGFLNPNNLRITAPAINTEDQAAEGENLTEEEKKQKEAKAKLHENIEKEFVEFLGQLLKEKREESTQMEARYGEYDAQKLIKELKFYVNTESLFEDDLKGEFQMLYEQAGITPKHAPLTSISELYLLAGWTEDVVNLVIDRMTVHEQGVISLNEMTEVQLKLIFPNITKEQIEDFFKYRDGDTANNQEEATEEEAPHPFKSVQEFKEIVTGRLAIIEAGKYDERIDELKKAGLSLGVSGKLFKVISRGEKNQAKVEIMAIVELPLKEVAPKKNVAPSTKGTTGSSTSEDGTTEEGQEVPPKTSTEEGKPAQDLPKEYLPPRIVEIHLN